jgi:putative ATP-dependent endonuclease of the OLD family
MSAKNTFRDSINQAFEGIELPDIDDHRKFGIDGKKVVLETIISVYEDSIALENRGSGMESLIKTQIALDRTKSGLDVILMEEPENHLCFTNLQKMLQEISAQQDKSQIIVATHSNMIASRLNLNNVLWITETGVKSLGGVDENVARFFVKADNNSFLQLLLSEKVILVEGATEFLLLPYFYKQIKNQSLEEDGISIISCNGISYGNYLEIATATGKKVAVITDNDKKQERIDSAKKFNGLNSMQHIYMGADINDWTWEACVYHANKQELDKLIKTQKNADYKVHGQLCESKVLGKMLNDKVDSAYQMQVSDIIFEVPQYVKDAISWLNE